MSPRSNGTRDDRFCAYRRRDRPPRRSEGCCEGLRRCPGASVGRSDRNGALMSLSDAFCLLCPAQLEPPPSPDADSAFPTRTSPSSDAPTAVHRKTESPPTTDVIPACFPALLSTSMPPHARASSPSPRPSPRTPRRPPAAPPSSVAHRPALESELCLPPAPFSDSCPASEPRGTWQVQRREEGTSLDGPGVPPRHGRRRRIERGGCVLVPKDQRQPQ